MKLSILSTVALATVAMGSALPKRETIKSECVKPYLCCGSLSTPLDSTVDPILKELGVDAANVVGEIGLDCMFSAIALQLSYLSSSVNANTLLRQGVGQVLPERSEVLHRGEPLGMLISLLAC